jgi:hypothetical protein
LLVVGVLAAHDLMIVFLRAKIMMHLEHPTLP